MSFSQRLFLAAGNGAAGLLWFMMAFVMPNGTLALLAAFTAILNMALCAASIILIDKDARIERYSKDWWG